MEQCALKSRSCEHRAPYPSDECTYKDTDCQHTQERVRWKYGNMWDEMKIYKGLREWLEARKEGM